MDQPALKAGDGQVPLLGAVPIAASRPLKFVVDVVRLRLSFDAARGFLPQS